MSILLLPLVLALLSLADVDVLACSCAGSSPCAEFGKAKVIFTGRMIEGSEKLGTQAGKDGQELSYEAGLVRFAVDEVFKGDKVSEITLAVSSNKETSCAYSMTRGEGAIENHSQTRHLILQKDLTGVNVSLSLPGFSGKGCK